MRKTLLIITLSLLCQSVALAQIDSVFISDVKFHNSKFNNPHAGSGFLLKYKSKIYGITAKHVLFFAKTDSMKTVSFGNELKSWTLKSKTKFKNSIKVDSLINENKEEKIEMPPKGDWLVFNISKKIPLTAKVFEIREKKLEIGEAVSFLGFPYKSEKPIRVTGTFLGFTKDGNLRLDVPKGNYGGCSGGPVFDKNGKLVGIVSMGYYNQKLKKQIFEPASLNYFKEVISLI